MEGFLWTGFYRVVDGELLIGPYQGSVGCLRIPFGKGVCGVAALSKEAQIFSDVHAFPRHIAWDAQSRSEIVVPVKNAAREQHQSLNARRGGRKGLALKSEQNCTQWPNHDFNSSLEKIFQELEACVLAFFRVKLGGEKISALDGSAEGFLSVVTSRCHILFIHSVWIE